VCRAHAARDGPCVMTNLLQDGVTWLGERLKESASVTIVYQRGPHVSDDLTVTKSLHEYEVIDTDGIMTTIKSTDYLIHAADLIVNDTVITPRSDDRVTEVVGGVSQTYEVMPLGPQKEYEPLDTDGVIMTVHTKRVA